MPDTPSSAGPPGDSQSIVSGAGTSDAAVAAATGRPWAEWFELLDAAGAEAWAHPQIARWLQDEQGVPAWWSQSVTVGFEQARGRRLPGQRADGSFEVSASKTLPLEQEAALDAVIRAVSESLGQAPVSERRTANYLTARWKLRQGAILASANPTKVGRTSVTLTHQRLPDAAAVGPAKAAMAAWLRAAASGPASGLD